MHMYTFVEEHETTNDVHRAQTLFAGVFSIVTISVLLYVVHHTKVQYNYCMYTNVTLDLAIAYILHS